MKSKPVVQTRTIGKKVIISLACGHVVHRSLGWWNRYFEEDVKEVGCPQCGGYRK